MRGHSLKLERDTNNFQQSIKKSTKWRNLTDLDAQEYLKKNSYNADINYNNL